jgi:hypothetical protein
MGQRASLMSDTGGKWQLNQILYADNTALLTYENCKLHSLVSELGEWGKGGNCL